MIDMAIRNRVLGLRNLPTLPEVVRRIVGTSECMSASAADLSAIVETDHAISARVLRLANSAFYGRPKRIGSMRDAVIVIGFDGVRLLAIATSVFDVLGKKTQKVLDPRDFWLHSLGAARASTLIGKHLNDRDGAETYFTAGLLHDFGKYLLALAFGSRYAEVLHLAQKTGLALASVERRELKTTHGEVGGWVARRWSFPERLVEVVSNAEQYIASPLRDVWIAAMADQISSLAGFGNAGVTPAAAVDPWLTNVLGISAQDATALTNELAKVRPESEKLLEELGGSPA